jgi:hypothetical protein
MIRAWIGLGTLIGTSVVALACGGHGSPTGPVTQAGALPSSQAVHDSRTGQSSRANSEQPPFNLEAILRGEGFGHVKFRQEKDPTANIIHLDVWVRDLAPDTSYSLQRAVDTTLDDECTGSNWLTLGQGSTPQPIVTDDNGTGQAVLWRDLSSFAPGTAFDIYFRIIENGTTTVALQSACYRFVVRD